MTNQLNPDPAVSICTVVTVSEDKLTLDCGHELHRLPRFDYHEWVTGDKINCYDCEMEKK